MSPIVVLLWLKLEALPNLANTDLDYVNSLNQNLMRFSFFFASVWNIWLLFWFLIRVAPYSLNKFFQSTNGTVSESITQRLEYIPAIHSHLVMTSTIIFAIPIFGILFSQMSIVPQWQIVFNVLILLLVLSIVLLIQRIIVQKIAFDFHRVAYNDRIKVSKHEMKILEQLKKAIKKAAALSVHGHEDSNSDKDKPHETTSLNPFKKSTKIKKEGYTVDFKTRDRSPSAPVKHIHSKSLPAIIPAPEELLQRVRIEQGKEKSILSEKDLENVEKGLPLTNDDSPSSDPEPHPQESSSPPAEQADFTSVNMASVVSEVLLSNDALTTSSSPTIDTKSISSIPSGNKLQIGLGGKPRKKYLEFSGERDAYKLAKQIHISLLKSTRKDFD
jgi:hypothetical protein